MVRVKVFWANFNRIVPIWQNLLNKCKNRDIFQNLVLCLVIISSHWIEARRGYYDVGEGIVNNANDSTSLKILHYYRTVREA